MITELSLRLISAKYAGRGRDYALLELAQEHFLEWMSREGLFSGGQLKEASIDDRAAHPRRRR